MTKKSKVLVVDRDEPGRARFVRLLTEAGFDVTATGDAVEARKALEDHPKLVLVGCGFDDPGGGLIQQIRSDQAMANVRVLFLTTGDDDAEVARAFEAGADDFLRKSVRGEELVARLRSHMRLADNVGEFAERERNAQVVLELTQALTSSLDLREILSTVVRRIADVINVERVSIVLAPEPEEENVGYVVVASDDETLSNLEIDLGKYPEIRQVLRTGAVLTIDDVATHPVLDGVRASVPQQKFGSMTLVPISWRDTPLGVLFARAHASRGSLTEREVALCKTVANTTAIALRNARVMQSLRDHTQQVTFARFEAERRLRSLKRYADLFSSSADGIAVVDAEGRLLFANPRAYEMLGHPEDSFRGESVQELLHAGDRHMARRLWAGFRRGKFPRDVDLRLRLSDGGSRIASVSFSPLVHEDGAVLFSFRDVTEHRRIESELVQTKEFLESLIHASVDGIVAADMKGNIILFNEGAENIYGYTADEVVGKMNVERLYPGRGAREVMAMIRSPQHGGPGKLETTRADALNVKDERFPISLSAAMIYEDGVPVATFGIFTDLRDRLRVEERLAHAQQKLAMTEKQALIAELAGTAAHELNQPLTSVMGYAELLKRKLEPESQQHQAADIIVREAERMAEIVRKIGKITKYETKSYVGGQRILDLDKATDTDPTSSASRKT